MPMRHAPGRSYNRSGGRGGRGMGHGSFKYVRPADLPAPGSAVEPATEPAAPGAPGAAAAAAPPAGHGGHGGSEQMAD